MLCIGLAAWLYPASAPAQSPDSAESPWRIGIALGYGQRSNPLIQSSDVPIVVDLDIAWFGKRFFFDNGDVGYTLLDRPVGTLSAMVRVNSDRVFFGKTNTKFVSFSAAGQPLAVPAPLKPPDRSFAVEAGLEYLADGNWGRLSVAAFRDVSAVHEGHAVDAEYAYPFHGKRWTLEPAVTLRYKSRSLNDYYWGVRRSEASLALPEYQADDGMNWQLGLRGSYYLTRHLRLTGSFNHERLNGSAARSPLVAERDVIGYFGGIAYRFQP